MEKHQLLPTPSAHLEQWSLPVQIYSFGSLAIVVNGQSIESLDKNQRKTLELLEMLISFGGRDVHCNHLASILWPNAEANLAHQALEITVNRLRKLIGKDAVLMRDGLLSLNEQHCWLDLWVFDATANELERVLAANGKPLIIDSLTDRLFKLYRGVFLKNTDSGLVILKQEQLLSKLCRLLDSVLDIHQVRGAPERIRQLLHRKLEINPLLEINYQRLINHYVNTGQQDAALRIYQQCHRILCHGFNRELSSDIQLLVKQIEQPHLAEVKQPLQ